MEDKILEILKNSTEDFLRKSQIRRAVIEDDEALAKAFTKTMRRLVEMGKVIKGNGGRYSLPQETIQVEATISLAPSGCGFAKHPDFPKDIFIPPRKRNGAVSGDKVLLDVYESNFEKGEENFVARVLEVLESSLSDAVGEFCRIGGVPYIMPLKMGIPKIKLCSESLIAFPDLEEGALIQVAEIIRDAADGELLGSLSKRMGDSGNLADEINAIIEEFDLEQPYNKEWEDRAGKMRLRPIERRDLQEETILTIDPVDAKDFDDALSVHPTDNPQHITIGIHIADVAAYIGPRAKLMPEIRKRCFTAYLPGQMIPMLPKVLVSNRCSLIEAEKKPAHTVMITYDKHTGERLKTERFHSWIKVKKRLDYDEVQKHLDTDFRQCPWDEDVKDSIYILNAFAMKLRDLRRREEQFVPIEVPEVRIMCDPITKTLLGLKREEHHESHQLVEEFMLAANSVIAEELSSEAVPGMFRVHPEPEEERAQLFSNNIFAFFGLNAGDICNRKNLLHFLKSISKHPCKEMISSELLRSMQRAIYLAKPAMHFGLGKGLYTHFTSPIRRICDLTVHQQLWEMEVKKTPIFSQKYLEELSEKTVEKEANVDEAYRSAGLRLKLHLLREEMEEGDVFVDAMIARVTAKGMKVYLQDYGLTSFVNFGDFQDDYYEAYPESGEAHGKRTGNVFSCGMSIKCKLDSINFIRRELSLVPIVEKVERSSRRDARREEKASRKLKGKDLREKRPRRDRGKNSSSDEDKSRQEKRSRRISENTSSSNESKEGRKKSKDNKKPHRKGASPNAEEGEKKKRRPRKNKAKKKHK